MGGFSFGAVSDPIGSGLVRDPQQERDDDVVGDERRPPSGNKRQGDSGEGEESQDTCHDEKGLETNDDG